MSNNSNYDNNGNRLVHVKAYNRSDGTFVKEHWRGKGESFAPKQEEYDWPPKEEKQKRPNEGEYPNNGGVIYANENGPVLHGGIEKTDLPSGDLGIFGGILSEILELLPMIMQIIMGFSGESASIPTLNVKLKENISKVKEHQNNYKIKMDNLLKNVVNAPNQEEYSKHLEQYVKAKNLYNKTEKAIYSAEHHVQNNDYKKAQEDIQSLRQEINASFSIPKEQLEQMQLKQMQAKQTNNTSPNNKQNNRIQKFSNKSDKTQYQEALSRKDNGNKIFYNAVTKKLTPDAAQFWNLYSNNFDANGMEYIKQNGQFVPSINNLPAGWREIVHAKVKQQTGLNDCVGIIFNENSSISRSIKNTDSFKLFLSKNLKQLLNTKILKNQSLSFPIQEVNSASALGKVDVPIVTLDNIGNITAVILDTYDFNPNSKNPIVQFVFPIQQYGFGNGYYSIILIHLTLKDILEFITQHYPAI